MAHKIDAQTLALNIFQFKDDIEALEAGKTIDACGYFIDCYIGADDIDGGEEGKRMMAARRALVKECWELSEPQVIERWNKFFKENDIDLQVLPGSLYIKEMDMRVKKVS